MKTCKIENCTNKYACKGFCKYHYNQQPETKAKAKQRLKKRENFLKKYRKEYHKNNREEILKKLKRYSQTIKGRFVAGKSIAKKRNMEWELSFEQYKLLIENSKCHYCPNQLASTGYGLDRIDNRLGYTFNNVVPCCGQCNMLRSNLITQQELVKVIELLKNIRNTDNIWEYKK